MLENPNLLLGKTSKEEAGSGNWDRRGRVGDVGKVDEIGSLRPNLCFGGFSFTRDCEWERRRVRVFFFSRTIG